jgi:hypothetical protein
MSISDSSLYLANAGQIQPPNLLCDQLLIWYWPTANYEHSELRPWLVMVFGDYMVAMEANSSIRGSAVSYQHIQKFREVVYNENFKWRCTESRGPESDTF